MIDNIYRSQKYTADEAVEKLADRSRIPSVTRSFYSPKLYDELLEIVENEELFELDAMLLQGDLTVQEMEEYLIVLPSYHDLCKRFYDWCDQLVEHLTRNLPRVLQESYDKRGRFSNKRGLVRLHKTLYDTFETFLNEDCCSKRNAMVESFKGYLAESITVEIWYRVVSNPKLAQHRDLLTSFLDSTDAAMMSARGHNYPGKIALSVISSFNSTFRKHGNLFRQFLSGALSTELELSTDELKLRIKEEFGLVDQLSHFRRIDKIQKQFGQVLVEIEYEDTPGAVRSSSIAFVKISFPGANPNVRLRLLGMGDDGMGILSTVIEHDSFQFVINRHTGQLTIGASQTSKENRYGNSIPIGEMPEIEYLQMKLILFRLLRQYLESKEEDIHKVFFVANETKLVQEVIDRQIEEVVADHEDQPVVSTDYGYEQESYEERVEGDSLKQAVIIQDAIINGSYDEQRVVGTISRITKIPALDSSRGKSRGKGSHVVLVGNNQARFPMPFHASKDISLRILKKCLQKLEIPYSTFLREY